MKFFKKSKEASYPVEPHLWGEWEQSQPDYLKIVAGSLAAIVLVGTAYLVYRAESRKATIENIMASRAAKASQKEDHTSKSTDHGYHEVAITPLTPEAQSKMDAFLTKATNLNRSPRDIRPIEIDPALLSPKSLESKPNEHSHSRSASKTPREALPTSRYPAAAASLDDIERLNPPEDSGKEEAPSKFDLNAPRESQYEVVPIRALSSKRHDGSHAAIGDSSVFSRDTEAFDAPARFRNAGHSSHSTSGLLRATPVSGSEPVFEEPNGQLKPSLVGTTSVPLEPLPISPSLNDAQIGRPAKTATVNIRHGDNVQRFTVRAYEPLRIETAASTISPRKKKLFAPSLPPSSSSHEVYQSPAVNCLPWIVQPGQTIDSLAAALKILPGEIKDLNQISQVVAGQLIYLPIHQTEIR